MKIYFKSKYGELLVVLANKYNHLKNSIRLLRAVYSLGNKTATGKYTCV